MVRFLAVMTLISACTAFSGCAERVSSSPSRPTRPVTTDEVAPASPTITSTPSDSAAPITSKTAVELIEADWSQLQSLIRAAGKDRGGRCLVDGL